MKYKHDIRALLEDWPADIDQRLAAHRARKVINPLFGLLHHGDPTLRWRAVVAMGMVTAALAEKETESARVIMRRLMWNLNDESGGIGWGSAEAMGEITARSAALAAEYGCIVVSYLSAQGKNFIEHPLLQRGTLWGYGRLAHARPQFAATGALLLAPFLETADPHLLAHAAWAAAAGRHPSLAGRLRRLQADRRPVPFFDGTAVVKVTVAEMAGRALAACT